MIGGMALAGTRCRARGILSQLALLLASDRQSTCALTSATTWAYNEEYEPGEQWGTNPTAWHPAAHAAEYYQSE